MCFGVCTGVQQPYREHLLLSDSLSQHRCGAGLRLGWWLGCVGCTAAWLAVLCEQRVVLLMQRWD
jgi:hypothetical protein